MRKLKESKAPEIDLQRAVADLKHKKKLLEDKVSVINLNSELPCICSNFFFD